LVKAGGIDFKDKNTPTPMTPVGKRACDQGTITVTLGSLPVVDSYPFLEAWVATGNGMCNAADRNSRSTTSGNTLNCTKIDLGDNGRNVPRPYATLDVPIKDALCGSDGKWTIFFLALTSQNAAEMAQSYGTVTFTLDTMPPDPPNGLHGGPGETQIEMKWNLPAGEKTQYSWLLVDTNPAPGGADVDGGDADAGTDVCHSNVMREGGDFDPNMVLPAGVFLTTEEQTQSSHTFNGDEDFFGSKLVSMTVVSGDRAGNPSKMSNIACVEVVPTSGFWDRYRNNGGTAEPGCACSAPGSRSGGMGLLAGLPSVALIGLLAVRRRRR
jgi:hypothetical protein